MGVFLGGFWHQGGLRISIKKEENHQSPWFAKIWKPTTLLSIRFLGFLCVCFFKLKSEGLGNKPSISFDEMDRFILSRCNFDVPRKPAGFFLRTVVEMPKKYNLNSMRLCQYLCPSKKSKSHQGIASGCPLGTPSLSHLAKGYIS